MSGRRCSGLNPRYTFEQFLTGTHNEMAVAAAMRIVKRPGRSYNPLFITGTTGLGKTHLLQAIGHATSARTPTTAICLSSFETAARRLIVNLQQGEPGLPGQDLLLIDDADVLAQQPAMREALLDMGRVLVGQDQQVVLTVGGSRPPGRELHDWFGSFPLGHTVELVPPDPEARRHLLEHFAAREPMPFTRKVLALLAGHPTADIRELRGAVVRLSAHAQFNHQPVSVELASQAVSDVFH